MSEETEPVSTDELIEVLQGRREFYLALAGFYLKPLTQEQIDTMAQTDYSSFGIGEPLIEDGFNDITRFLRKRHTGTRQMLAIDFTSSFGGTQTYGGINAIPCASIFLSETGLFNQQARAEVFSVYTRNLLRNTASSVPDDHLSFLLEFLAIMSSRAAEALGEGRVEDAKTCLVESRDFINDHILSWFDQLAEAVNNLIKARFYRGVMKVTKGYLLMDLKTIDDLMEEMV